MKVSEFTEPELNYLRLHCNFVGSERTVFELRSKGISLEEIAEQTEYSHDGIKKISRRVNNKIIRVL